MKNKGNPKSAFLSMKLNPLIDCLVQKRIHGKTKNHKNWMCDHTSVAGTYGQQGNDFSLPSDFALP